MSQSLQTSSNPQIIKSKFYSQNISLLYKNSIQNFDDKCKYIEVSVSFNCLSGIWKRSEF